MKEFKFLDYCTEYSCKGDLKKEMNREGCFGYVFDNIEDNSDVVYNILLYKGVNYSKKKHFSNACLFTKKEIRNHLRLLKIMYPFSYSVRDYGKKDGFDVILVQLHLKDVPGTFHKYILTWLRYTYEYPYNVLLKDAYLLRKDSTFRFESIANLFNLTIGCFCDNPRDIHQIPRNQVSIRMKVSDIKERIKKVYFLSDIYEKLRSKNDIVPKSIGNYSVEDIEYWETGFETRKPIYMKVYKDIKR